MVYAAFDSNDYSSETDESTQGSEIGEMEPMENNNYFSHQEDNYFYQEEDNYLSHQEDSLKYVSSLFYRVSCDFIFLR
jgi:hypothetical protein